MDVQNGLTFTLTSMDMDLSYEFLSGMGVTIYDEDYVSMVLIPSLIVTLLTWKPSRHHHSSGHTFTTQDFISKAIELSDK